MTDYKDLIVRLKLDCRRNCKLWDGTGCRLDGDCSSHAKLEAAAAIEELQQTTEHYKGCADDWYREACDYKAMIPRWIPVMERLPEEWKSVLTYQPYVGDEEKPLIRVSWYIGAGSWRECEQANKLELPVTHWMPLPAPPEEEEE